MNTKIIFFGFAGYDIITPENKHVIIDPFLTNNPAAPFTWEELEKADLMLITHNAYDHFGDAPQIIKKFNCPVICAKDVAYNLTKYHGVDPDLVRVTIWGMELEVLGIRVRPVESVHWSFAVAEDGQLLSGPALGFIIQTEPDVRIYHPGDTAITQDMKLWGELYKPNVGLMHIMLPEDSMPHMECYMCGELTEHEVILASKWLGLEHIIASHYVSTDSFGVKSFLDEVARSQEMGDFTAKITVLEPGKVLKI